MNRLGRLHLAILAGLPFYLPLSVWIASNVGSIYVLSAWKELLLLIMIMVLAKPLGRLFRHPDPWLRRLNWLIGAYCGLALLYVLAAHNLFEFGAGWLFATRFLGFFLVAQVLGQRVRHLPAKTLRLIGITALVLAGLAVLQAFILPPTFLERIGYEGINQEIPGFPPAVTTLGDIDDFIRPQASLRGPNPLGAFLILPLCGFLWQAIRQPRRRLQSIGAILLLLDALALTFSRSAWIGGGVALAITAFACVKRKRLVLQLCALTFSLSVLLLTLSGAGGRLRLILLHEETPGSSFNSNSLHLAHTTDALRDISRHPFGYGPGNAGPVSALDQQDVGRIAENYFLQVAQETGWLGAGLFITIHALLLGLLYRLRRESLALVALASFIGLIITNLLLHTWADDAVAIIWWSFAGSIIGASMLSPKRKGKTV